MYYVSDIVILGNSYNLNKKALYCDSRKITSSSALNNALLPLRSKTYTNVLYIANSVNGPKILGGGHYHGCPQHQILGEEGGDMSPLSQRD